MSATTKDAVRLVREFAEETAKSRTKADQIDAADLRRLADLIEAKDGKKAYRFFRNLDTFIREGVPEDVVQWLYQRRSGKDYVMLVPMHLKLKGCKKVFKKGWPPGVVVQTEAILPADTTANEAGLWMMTTSEKFLNESVEVVIGKQKKEKIKE